MDRAVHEICQDNVSRWTNCSLLSISDDIKLLRVNRAASLWLKCHFRSMFICAVAFLMLVCDVLNLVHLFWKENNSHKHKEQFTMLENSGGFPLNSHMVQWGNKHKDGNYSVIKRKRQNEWADSRALHYLHCFPMGSESSLHLPLCAPCLPLSATGDWPNPQTTPLLENSAHSNHTHSHKYMCECNI